MSSKWSIGPLMAAGNRGAIPLQKLVGADDQADSHVGVSPNFLVCQKFVAAASGAMTQFRLRANTSANVQVGIYTDNAGVPDVLLNSVDSTAVVSGINIISFPATSISAGTTYWLATNMTVTDAISNVPTGGHPNYKSLTFGTAFPNPSGGGFSNTETWLMIEAGWGS